METIKLKDKYFLVPYDKELSDTKKLIDKVKRSDWVQKDMIIVNCFPEYSARLAQLTNHGLSFVNGNELFEQIDLQMPYPNMAQVWNPCDRKYQGFHNYITDWVRINVFSTGTYLFLTSKENLSVIRPFLKVKLEPDDFRMATLYPKAEDPKPDFWIEEADKTILFEWENMDNPNWNY